jgi:hypothetical protein
MPDIFTALTVTEYTARVCVRCGGAGRLACFQHNKGGQCFRCGGTGTDPDMVETHRPMTDDEVMSALSERGFPVIFAERADDAGLFLSDAEAAQQAETLHGARIFLSALLAAA